jgi:hypothetical protein
MGPAPLPARRKPVTMTRMLDKFAFVDASNYCVAEIDHNPLVTGRIEHVEAKHFLKSPARARQQQSQPQPQSRLPRRTSRAEDDAPAATKPAGAPPASRELLTDSEVLALELPDLLRAKKAFEMFADEEYEAKRGEGAAASGFLHAPDDLKMDMTQFVDFFSRYTSSSEIQREAAALGSGAHGAEAHEADFDDDEEAAFRRAPASVVTASAPAPGPLSASAVDASTSASASASPPPLLVSVPVDEEALGGMGSGLPPGFSARLDAERLERRMEAERLAEERRAALPYLFMRIDCDSDGFVTCE